ncbi:MAG TPA: endonuclease III [Chloroflexota bacterium]|jgi:endonuclease-3|nr:endonuclease III [Chloroflexota bacterium]
MVTAERTELGTPAGARAGEVIRRLHAAYPDARCSLAYADAFQLLVATILSAQCTDERVNMVTPLLFARFPTPAALAEGSIEEVEALIKSTGFYHNKAKSILGAARRVVEEFGGEVPRTMAELLTVPGAARKTANVVLSNAYDVVEGIAVDTHVGRLAGRLGFSAEAAPEKIERDLMRLLPQEEWCFTNHALIAHGRGVCQARKPNCAACVLLDLCPTGQGRQT